MKNKKVIICLSSLLAISLLLSGCGKKAKVKDGDEVAVSIKGKKITATDYYEAIKEKEIAELIDMIDKSILNKEYESDDEEKEEIQEQIDQIKKNFDDDEQYKSAIKQYFGVDTEKELKEMLKLEYKRKKAVEDYISTNLTKKEIQSYYDENVVGDIKASHILITPDVAEDASTDDKTKAEEAAYEKAKKIIKQLEKGKDFAELAQKYSKDDTTVDNGGDLGYFDPNKMVEEFANAVKELKDGEYTKEPVKTKYGYHIILRDSQKEKDTLENVKEDIKEKLTEQKLNEDSTLYYKSLIKYRESKKIKWNDSKLEKAYNDYMDNLITNATSN